MQILCHKCGRPACDIKPPEFNAAERVSMRAMLRSLGVDLGPQLEVILNPTAEQIAQSFEVRCVNGCEP